MPQPTSSISQRLIAALPELPVSVPNGLHAFFYHVVSDRSLPHVRHLYAYKTPAQFEQDLLFLESNYQLVRHEDILRHIRGQTKLPANAAAISFDDGLAECFDVVRPLLLTHRAPCTFFVVRDLLDNRTLMHKNAVSLCLEILGGRSDGEFAELAARLSGALGFEISTRTTAERSLRALTVHDSQRVLAACTVFGVDPDDALRRKPYLSSAQVRQLARDGFTIGGHTCRHAELDSFTDFAEAEREVVESCEFVRELTGQADVPFAITFNGLRLPRASLAAMLARHPFISVIYDTNDLLEDQPFIVNRIWADTAVGAGPHGSNLPYLLKRAKALEPIRRWKRRLQRLPR